MWKLVCGLVATFALFMAAGPLAADYGDCTGYQNEGNADCDNLGDCKPADGNCYALLYLDPENPLPEGSNFVVWTTSMEIGKCHNGYWDSGCVRCDELVCAEGTSYSGMDENDQCFNQVATIVAVCFDCCGG